MKTVLKTIAGLSITELIGRTFNFLSFIIIARFIDKTGFGNFSLLITIVSFFIVLIILSSDNYGIKEFAKNRKEFIPEKYLVLRAILFIPVSIILIMVLYLFYKELFNLFNILSSLFYLSSFIFDYSWVFVAEENVKPIIKGKLFSGLINLILTVIIVNYLSDIYFLLLILGFSNYCNNLFLIFNERLKLSEFNVDFRKYLRMLKEIMPLSLASLLIITYYHIDILMIGLYKDSNDVALYSAAYKLLSLMVIPATLLFKSFTPQLAISESSKFESVLFKYSFFTGLFISFMGFIFSSEILSIIYGKEYAGASHVLKILSVASFIIYLNIPLCNKLIVEGKNNLYLKIILFGAIFNFSANFYVIQSWGIIGAAVITLLTELVILLIGIYFRLGFYKIRSMG